MRPSRYLVVLIFASCFILIFLYSRAVRDSAIIEKYQKDILNNGDASSANSSRSAAETSCATLPGNINETYPSCLTKFNWLRSYWRSDPCYSDYGVDGTACSVRSYLSMVEDHCPPIDGQRRMLSDTAMFNGNMSELFSLMIDTPVNYKFMKSRIARLWTKWTEAIDYNKVHHAKVVDNRKRLNVILHLGFLMKEHHFNFGSNSEKGSPLGELVQWADLISSLFVLGHNLFISTEKATLQRNLLLFADQSPCPTSRGHADLIVTDIIGLRAFKLHKQFLLNNRCRIRILDSFGTQVEFNYRPYFNAHKNEFGGSLKNPWGGHGLKLQQYWTFYPHTPDNSFLGFVVDTLDGDPLFERSSRNAVLVYGKQQYMWEGKEKVIGALKSMAEVHATVSDAWANNTIFEKVVNHGVLPPDQLYALLKSVKVFVGMGFPFEGPAPLEAMAYGAVFINAKFDEPKSRRNTQFFADKPTLREWTSQCPYFETIGSPHSYTVNIDDTEALTDALRSAIENEPPPHIPEEFTARGMLLRVSQMVSRQDFCENARQWPPLDTLKIKVSSGMSSCEQTCDHDDLVCEPALFASVNTPDILKKLLGCVDVRSTASVLAPHDCLLQSSAELFSCSSRPQQPTRRICPCRRYYPGHRSLCETCA